MIKVKSFLSNNRYGVFFFAGLLIRMLMKMPYSAEHMDDPFTYLFYIVDYKTAGFVPRALLGSFFSLFIHRMTIGIVYIIAVVITLLLILTASLLVNRVFKHEFEGRTALFLILCTFLLLSDENFYIFDSYHFGIVDVWFILMTLIIVCFAEHKILRWFIPVICFMCMAIYEGYVFAFMAAAGIVMLYVCIKEKKLSAWAVLVLSCIAAAASFAYFYVFFRADYLNMLRYETSEELTAALQQRTDNMEISWMVSQLYYYVGSMTMFTDGRWDVSQVMEVTSVTRKQCLPTALIFCAMIMYVWLGARKNEKNKKFRIIWILCMLAPLTAAPFLVFSEQMKYISYFTFSQFILLMYFAGKENAVRKPLAGAEKILLKNPFLICIPWGMMIFFRSIW